MKDVTTALLFVGNPTLALEHFFASLNTKLAKLNLAAEEISPQAGAQISFRTQGVTVSVSCKSMPVPADKFKGALKSPLSKPSIGLLAETLSRHTRHMVVTVADAAADAPENTNLLTRLQLAHATTSLLAEWHMPAAVHWQQSNQLLTGAQYLQLATEVAPWALFARAEKIAPSQQDQMVRTHGLRLSGAVDFIDRPIQFRQTSLAFDEVHAAALSFLRHAVETGAPIPHGHTFGSKGGTVFRLMHIDPFDQMPNGMFELSVVADDADIALGGPARPPKALDPAAPTPGDDDGSDGHARKRSMAISYFMLAILPPVGAVLLMSNALFGSNVWRTGMVALGSVALAVVVGTYVFMNNGIETTALLQTETIQAAVLND